MKTSVLVSPKPPPHDLIVDGGGVAIVGESFAEWMRVQDSAGTHWTVVSDRTEQAGGCEPVRVVVLGRYI